MKFAMAFIAAVIACAVCFADGAETIWRIGQKDSDFAEFALPGYEAVNGFSKAFPNDVNYTIGKDSAKDWPAVHPAGRDSWAGSREHTFTVNFSLEENACELYALIINLTSAQNNFPPLITVCVNDTEQSRQASAGPGDNALRNPKAGGEQSHTFYFTRSALKAGANQVRITTHGSWLIYDSVELCGYPEAPAVTAFEASTNKAVYRTADGEGRAIELSFGGGCVLRPVDVTLDFAGRKYKRRINPEGKALGNAQVFLPAGSDEAGELTVSLEDFGASAALSIEPVRKWEVHLIHQTHLDIGYTDKQENVLREQVSHLRKALDCIDASRDYPAGARFKWHPEGMWAVEEFMRTESAENVQRLISAARAGDVHIDALYAQAMTGAYSEEELFELVGEAMRFGAKYGIEVDSAMQTDVPGYTWGLVEVLGSCGVKYMNVGPNSGHRVGHTFEWGDKPFYWLSPSGKYKLLFWMAGKGYSWFHGSPVGHSLLADEGKIFGYLGGLEAGGYPYDMVNVRYNIGRDNGPPNPALPDAVKQWNEKYVWPRLVISNNSEMMREFELRCGDKLPVESGDFTPYWEDGMASTAADTGISRRAAEELVQAQTLWTLLRPQAYPQREFEQAWNKLIMYDEHTWGAWNSISAPDDDFAVQQALFKQKYALDGADMAQSLLAGAIGLPEKSESGVLDVYNTQNRPRSGIVTVSAKGARVTDENGRAVASQRLSSGKLAFAVSEVPAFGAKRYFITNGKPKEKASSLKVKENVIENALVRVEIDRITGAIKSLRLKETGEEFADSSKGAGLNDYLYITGRDADKNNMRIDSPVRISIMEAGPLVAELKVECKAPGAARLTRTIRLLDGSDVVEIVNSVDKLKERRPEGLFFNFPFNVPGGKMEIDTPWSVFEPEKGQIAGANKNFFCVQRFVDISNDTRGATWMPLDAPIVQWDPIRIASPFNKNDFRTTIAPNQTIHSWVMNNHWETNYKADQSGLISFAYAIRPHSGGYDAAAAQRVSRDVCKPLIAVQADSGRDRLRPSLEVGGKGIEVTSLKPCADGNGFFLRIFNGSRESSTARVKWGENARIRLSNPMEEEGELLSGELIMKPQEIVMLRIEP